MRKFSFIFLLAVLPLALSADDTVSGLVITKTNGERVEVAIAHLRSIKFGSDTMVLYRQSADPISVPLAEVQSLTFDDIITAVRTVLDPEAEGTLTITDLAGRIVYRGNAHGDIPRTLRGTFILTQGGRSQKVVIR